MLIFNSTSLNRLAANRVAARLADQRDRHAAKPPSTMGNSPNPVTFQVVNHLLAIFPGKQHSVDHPLLHVGDIITVTRRMSHGCGWIFFFHTSDNLEGFIRSDAVIEVV